MVLLGVVERPVTGRLQLGAERAVPSVREGPLSVRVDLAGLRVLRLVHREQRRAVLRADVVALPEALGGVVGLEELPHQLLVADLPGIEADPHRLGVPGASRTTSS